VQVGSAVARTLFDDLGAGARRCCGWPVALMLLAVLRRPCARGPATSGCAALLGGAMGAMNLSFYLSCAPCPLASR
jgi:inner membrane transporter RhtA